MPISFQCSNGHQLKVKEELAGKKIKCPKCEVVVQVPVADTEAQATPIAQSRVQAKPHVSAAPARPAAVSPGLDSFDFDLPAAAPLAAAPVAPAGSAYMPKPALAPVADLPSVFGPEAKKILLVYGGGSTIASFLIVALTGFLFFSGSGKSNSNAATVAQTSSGNSSTSANPTTTTPMAPSSESPSASPTPEPAGTPEPPADSDKPKSAAKESSTASGDDAAKVAGSPNDLRSMFKDEASQWFVLPGDFVSNYYDSSTSRYYMGDSKRGVVVFNMEEVLAGKLSPESVLPLGEERPLSMCIQMVDKQPFLLVGTAKTGRIRVFNMADWKELTHIALPGENVVEIFPSALPNDPTLFVALNIQGNRGGSHQLVTYNFKTQQVTPRITADLMSLAVSPNGRFVAASNGSAMLVYEWDGQNLLRSGACASDRPWAAFGADRLVVAGNIWTIDGSYKVGNQTGIDYVESRKFPLSACWSDKELLIYSTNDNSVLTTKAFDPEWMKFAGANVDDGGFSFKRLRGELFFDDKLQAVVGRQRNKLLITKFGAMGLPQEPDLRPATSLPATIEIGQQMVGSLGLPTGVTLKCKPTTEGLEMSRQFTVSNLIAGAPIQPRETSPDKTIVRPDETPPVVPLTKEDKVAWKPGKGTAGMNLIRLEATLDKTTRELYCPVRVVFPSVTVPFDVFGMSCDRDRETVLAWGYPAAGVANRKWQVAIVDLTRKKPVRAAEVSGRVFSGCIDKSNFYLCVETSSSWINPEPSYLRDEPSPNSPLQLCVYELDSMKESRKTPLKAHAQKMESINGKELILDDRQPISLPGLTPKPNIDFSRSPMSGRVGNGWLTDGVLFDKDLRKALLCIYLPNLGFKSSMTAERPVAVTGGYGIALDEVGGPQFQRWETNRYNQWDKYTPISNFPGGLLFKNGELALRTSLPSNFSDRTADWKPEWQLPIFDVPDSRNRTRPANPITISSSAAAFANRDRIWIAPLAAILPTVDDFQFAQVQDKFILNAHKPTSVVYKAPKANSYHLTIYIPNKIYNYNESLQFDSRDGKFNIEFTGDELALYAKQLIQRVVSKDTITLNEIKQYQQACKDDLEVLGDRKGSGVVVPIFAIATATRDDGQICAMTHCYLVEVSPNAILKLSQNNR